ncbi:MAG: hypothetical protein WCD11_33910 [Solirubrobacteraceae bacterium]
MAAVKGAGTILASWNDTPATQSIVEFVERVTQEGGADYVPPAERIAVFDNDGTLWCEKPIQIEVGFILKRLAEMAELDDSLRDRQPWKAAHERDYAWLGGAITKHYERVIGSSNALSYQEDEHGGTLVYLAQPDVFDDGPTKPVRIWSRIGRRPIVAGGNSNGDTPVLRYAGGPARSALRLLVLHDDPEREFDYTAGAETSLEAATNEGWTVVSIKRDWANVFTDT